MVHGFLPRLHRGCLPGPPQDDAQARHRRRRPTPLYGASGTGGETDGVSGLPRPGSDQQDGRHQYRAAVRKPQPVRLPRRPAPEDRPAAEPGLLLCEPGGRGVQQARHQRRRQHLQRSGPDPVQSAVHLRRTGTRQDAPHPGYRHRHQGEVPGPRGPLRDRQRVQDPVHGRHQGQPPRGLHGLLPDRVPRMRSSTCSTTCTRAASS